MVFGFDSVGVVVGAATADVIAAAQSPTKQKFRQSRFHLVSIVHGARTVCANKEEKEEKKNVNKTRTTR